MNTNSLYRYFYTDPLAAMWMAKHHGMKFVGFWDGDKSKLPVDLHLLGNDFSFKTGEPIPGGDEDEDSDDVMFLDKEYFIDLGSLHLLEPVVGDLVKDTSRPNGETYYQRPCGESRKLHNKRLALEYLWLEIIQRHGKAFHWPKVVTV